MNINTYHKSRKGRPTCPPLSFARSPLFRFQPCKPTSGRTHRFAPTVEYRQSYSSRAGFTLVELVVTIVIIGILSSLGGMFISQPIEGYIDLERRTELVDQAEMALRRMQRDIRSALPNSVREIEVGGKIVGIELIHVVDGGRYRRAVNPAIDITEAKKNILKFTSADKYFEVLGGLQHSNEISAGNYVVIYNLTADPLQGVANAYFFDNTAEIDAPIDATFITLKNSKKFPYASPYNRFFIVDEAVSYKIVANGISDYDLMRYTYPIADSIVGPPADVVGDLVATHLKTTSTFAYDSATTSRSGLVTMQLALENKGERITLLHQVHVDNAP